MPAPRENYTQNYLHAHGNLTYLEFIAVLSKMWGDSHPEIPLHAAGTYNIANYPCILYSLESRKPLENEPKPKVRETLLTPLGDDQIVNKAQRFMNYMKFTALSRHDPQQAESIIEVLENFLLEYTGVFLQLGVGNMFYGRRLPDSEEVRENTEIVSRSLTYLVILEKIFSVSYKKLESVLVDARLFLANNQATPALYPATPPFTSTGTIVDTRAFGLQSATPTGDIDLITFWDPDSNEPFTEVSAE